MTRTEDELMNNELIDRWTDAYIDLIDEDIVSSIRDEIEKKLRNFINDYIDNSRASGYEVKMLSSVESRIKSVDSFKEKLRRDNYVEEWKIQADEKENQLYIMEHLPDLIGFRITCFFTEDETKVFDEFKQFEKEVYSLTDATKVVDNGMTIHKYKGVCDKDGVKCCFEIQVKSMVHHYYEEIDHRTIYKRRNYCVFQNERKRISLDTRKVLSATDEQLKTLYYNMDFVEEQYIRGLFYEYTKTVVKQQYAIDILGKCYDVFFAVYGGHYFKEIKEYVGTCILNKQYSKHKVSCNLIIPASAIKSKLQKEFSGYLFEIIYSIASLMFEFESEDDFYQSLVCLIEVKNNSEYKMSDFDADQDDFNGDDNEKDNDSIEGNLQILMNEINDVLGVRK